MDLNGKLVRVYFNLHRNLFSVQLQIEKKVNGKTRKQWQVIGHTNVLMLKNVTFKVSESGRQRVLSERKKNVHAYVTGTLVTRVPGILETEVSYNPYKMSTFYYRDTELPCFMANSAILCLVDGNKPQIRVNG